MNALIESLVFYGIAALILGSALGVVCSRNIMHSALFLVLCFLGIAACFLELQAGFLGMMQILIYGGAVSVLIIFAVMLVMNERSENTNPDHGEVSVKILALLVSGGIFSMLALAIRYSSYGIVNSSAPSDGMGVLASMMMGNYVIAFELAAVLLLIAVVGAIIISKGEDEVC